MGHFTTQLPKISLTQGFLGPFYCLAAGKPLSGDFIGHMACCASSLPTTSLPIADFACILPNFPAFLLGIGRMKIFHSFSPKTNSLFGLSRKYSLHMPISAQQISILATLLYILVLLKHIPLICPKLALRPANSPLKLLCFPENAFIHKNAVSGGNFYFTV